MPTGLLAFSVLAHLTNPSTLYMHTIGVGVEIAGGKDIESE